MARLPAGPLALKRRRARLVSQLPDLERLLRGSLVEHFKKCGKPGCHCTRGAGHGPSLYLSVTLAPGKTRSYYIPAHLRQTIAQYLANHRKLRELTEEITRINRELLAQGVLGEDDP